MKTRLLFATLLCAGWSACSNGQTPSLGDEARQFVRSRHIAASTNNNSVTESPRIRLDALGHLRHIAAAPGFHFLLDPGWETQPFEAAREFILSNRRFFGLSSISTDFVLNKSRQRGGRTVIRMDQVYRGIPILGAQAVVQIGAHGGIESIVNDVARNLDDLDQGRLRLQPTITPSNALARVRAFAAVEAPGQAISNLPPVLSIFAPSVLGQMGPFRLVWDISIATTDDDEFAERILLDAHTGEVARRYPLNHFAKNREIHDADRSKHLPGTKVRDEGDPATGDVEVDDSYDFAGDTYDFYQSHFGRDGINDRGGEITVSVRYCAKNTCPYYNAYWSPFFTRMVFGPNMVADDVMGHELTHGITDKESSLIYSGASGAINESISDIFGEFVDLSNSAGNDNTSVRWLLGEDVPLAAQFTGLGAIRDMADPTQSNQPDRLGSSLFVSVSNPNKNNDYGGVHVNSGVNNKLAYLLTDGGIFNGQTVSGLGISRVAALYYEANVNHLSPTADWTDLYDALNDSAVDLNWSSAERANLYRACLAVEIASAPENIYVNLSSACLFPLGGSECVLSGGVFYFGPYHEVVDGMVAMLPGDHLVIHGGTYEETDKHGKLIFDTIGEIHSYNGNAIVK